MQINLCLMLRNRVSVIFTLINQYQRYEPFNIHFQKRSPLNIPVVHVVFTVTQNRSSGIRVHNSSDNTTTLPSFLLAKPCLQFLVHHGYRFPVLLFS